MSRELLLDQGQSLPQSEETFEDLFAKAIDEMEETCNEQLQTPQITRPQCVEEGLFDELQMSETAADTIDTAHDLRWDSNPRPSSEHIADQLRHLSDVAALPVYEHISSQRSQSGTTSEDDRSQSHTAVDTSHQRFLVMDRLQQSNPYLHSGIFPSPSESQRLTRTDSWPSTGQELRSNTDQTLQLSLSPFSESRTSLVRPARSY